MPPFQGLSKNNFGFYNNSNPSGFEGLLQFAKQFFHVSAIKLVRFNQLHFFNRLFDVTQHFSFIGWFFIAVFFFIISGFHFSIIIP
jgi:hypothetical protein